MCDPQGEEMAPDAHFALKPSASPVWLLRGNAAGHPAEYGAAIRIYQSLGFEPIPPYWNNTVPGILYFGRLLSDGP